MIADHPRIVKKRDQTHQEGNGQPGEEKSKGLPYILAGVIKSTQEVCQYEIGPRTLGAPIVAGEASRMVKPKTEFKEEQHAVVPNVIGKKIVVINDEGDPEDEEEDEEEGIRTGKIHVVGGPEYENLYHPPGPETGLYAKQSIAAPPPHMPMMPPIKGGRKILMPPPPQPILL